MLGLGRMRRGPRQGDSAPDRERREDSMRLGFWVQAVSRVRRGEGLASRDLSRRRRLIN